ncbi:hypothetical protein [Komagataeibacter kakiaceti]|uniref:hypothetical protein n=1 Tax=Komagataeibacter kakiaceti TaxID=943261 RepID=UPI000ADF15E2|nr:hypothetical protein [Komagataeibacter kakiaceti]
MFYGFSRNGHPWETNRKGRAGLWGGAGYFLNTVMNADTGAPVVTARETRWLE